MKFYDDTKLLYVETDVSGVGLGAVLLPLHEDAMCQKDMAPDNTILCPIAFASKSLTGAECRYSNIEQEAAGHTTWTQEVSSLLFCQGCTHHHRPQTAGSNIYKGHGHAILVHTVHIT